MALAYARALARPRRVGSGEDEAVAREIVTRLEQFGWQVERQPFEFSTAPAIFVALEILASQLLILAGFWARGGAARSAPLFAALLLVLLFLAGPLNRVVRAGSIALPPAAKASPWSGLCLRLGARHRAANLAATWPGFPDRPALPRLVLMAHYDSKSQRLPLGARVALFVVALAGAGFFAALTLLGGAFPALSFGAGVAGLIALLSGIPLLLFQDVGNASPGAIDDASGLGLVLHLAEVVSGRLDLREKLRVTILVTGAEEMAVMGAAFYAGAHAAALRRTAEGGGLYFLNFDGIGPKGKLYVAGGQAGGSRLSDLVREACGELGLPLGRFGLPGVLFDHIPFTERGLDALTLMTVGRASWWVHTPHDSADKLDVEGFRQAGEVALRVIKTLAG